MYIYAAANYRKHSVTQHLDDEPGKDVKIGMDCASSEFFKNGIYDYSIFEGENGKKRTADEQIAYLEDLILLRRGIMNQ